MGAGTGSFKVNTSLGFIFNFSVVKLSMSHTQVFKAVGSQVENAVGMWVWHNERKPFLSHQRNTREH